MNIRNKAYEILCGVMLDGQYASLTLRRSEDEISPADRALLTRLVYGTLQNYRYVRFQWQPYVTYQPSAKTAVLLDMTVYQLLLADRLPVYAVINEAVEIAKHVKPAEAGLVNAVSRKVAANGPAAVKGSDELQTLGIQTSHPDWLVRMWKAHYGYPLTVQICQADQLADRTALRVNTLKTTRDKLLQDPAFTAGPLADSVFYQGDIMAASYFKDHLVDIQALSSQLAVPYLDPQPDDCILDMCAAPGTKTVQMAIMMQDRGRIDAFDIYPQRVKLIQQTIRQHQLSCVSCQCADSTALPLSPESYAKILLDAPCSGLGTLKNKADIRLRIKPENIDEIVQLQSRLLDSAAGLLKKGGCLVYSTCTLNKKENERQLAAFIGRHPDFTLDCQRTVMPMELDSDGFFIGRLYKNGADMVE